MARTPTRILLVALVVFTALTAAMTYPQVLHLRDGVHDEGDPLLNTWALAWVAHQLPRAPAHLFDGNIFAPERRTLAFSETLIAPGAIAAPLQWLGAGPILVSNIVLLSGFIVSGAGVALLVATLTGQAGAGILAGIVFAFLPYRLENYPQLQLQQTQFLPFALWAFHRLLARGRIRDGAWLGVFTAAQILSCTYYGLFLLPYMAVVCGSMLIMDRPMPRPRLLALVLAAAIVVVAVIPVARAYGGARQAVGERASGEVAAGSATPANYLAASSGSLLYGRVFERFAAPERRLFPGFVAIALAITGFVIAPLKGARYNVGDGARYNAGDGARYNVGDGARYNVGDGARYNVGDGARYNAGGGARYKVAYALGLLLAFDMSLGFNGFTYRVLYDYVIPFRAIRVPARMGIFAEFSLAVLAGFGAAAIVERLPKLTARRILVGALAALMLAEYASRPMDIEIMPLDAPRAYADIMRDKDAAGASPTATLFEFPISPGDDPTYMYYSTFHWQRLVNGYSGFFPASYLSAVDAARHFPDEASMSAIKAHQTRYLVIHGERLLGARYETLIPDLDKRPDLTLLSRTPAARPGQHGEISVYRVVYSRP